LSADGLPEPPEGMFTPLRYRPSDPYVELPNSRALQQWTLGSRRQFSPAAKRGISAEEAWDFLARAEMGTLTLPRDLLPERAPDDLPPDIDTRLFGLGGDAVLNQMGEPTGQLVGRPVFAIVDNGVDLDHPDLQANMLELPDSFDCTVGPPIKFVEGDGGPGPTYARHRTLNAHGTAVTGIAAADRDNGEGITGIAPDAYWSSHRVLLTIDPGDPVTSARNTDIGEAMCLAIDPPIGPVSRPGSQSGKKDIYINAWGPVDATDWRTTESVPRNITRGAILDGYNFGRLGWGNIYVWAGGNGGQFADRVDYDQYASNRFSIAVAAVDDRGHQAQYSEEGASLFIAAPSSVSFDTAGPDRQILTTDIDDEDPNCGGLFAAGVVDYGGYNWHLPATDPRNDFAECPIWPDDEDDFNRIQPSGVSPLAYTTFGHWSPFDAGGGFGGTSASAPLVGGVIALMLDAADDGPDGPGNLTPRDVQHILTRSAYLTGGVNGWTPRNFGQYQISPDISGVNPTGAHINHKYGFGAIDALTAVKESYDWQGVSSQYFFTSGNLAVPRQPFDPPGSIGRRIPDNTGQAAGQIYTMLPGQTWRECAIQRWDDCQGDDIVFPNALPPIEWVEVTLETEHPFAGDLEVTLIHTQPDGTGQTRAEFAKRHNSAEPYTNWKFVTPRYWGETPLGNWNLQVKDVKTGDIGSWLTWEIRFFTGMPLDVPGAAAPVGSDDDVTALSGVFTTFDVAANDGPDADSRTVEIVQGPDQGGTITVLPDGRIRYRSRPGYVSGPLVMGVRNPPEETFTYRIRSEFGLPSAPITVSVVVNALPPDPPDPPTAVNDSFSTPVNTPANFPVLDNDIEPDPGDALNPATVAIVSPPPAAAGTVAILPSGEVRFTPAMIFIGSTQFSYTVRDETNRLSNVATVMVTVSPGDINLPQAVSDAAATPSNTPTIINVLANDSSPDSPLNVASTTIATPPIPAQGTAAVNPATGQVTFTPAAGFFGAASFAYNVRDQRGFLSNTATVTVNVKAPPQAVSDTSPGFQIPEGTIGLFAILANDFDPDGTIVPSSVTIVSQPTHGSVTVNPSTGAVTYTPDCEYAGPDTFSYTIRDNEGQLSNIATVNVSLTEVEDAPTAVDDTARTAAGTPVDIDITSLLANDRFGDEGDDFDVASFAIPIGGQPRNGTASIAAGRVTYTPSPGFTGGDSFTYFIRDTDNLTSNAATVRIRVGDPVSLSGRVYIDTNLNGVFDVGELPVQENEIVITVTDGLYTHTQSVRTDATGTFAAVDNPATGLILPRGTYSISQVHPALMVDGVDTAGTPSPAVSINDGFSGIVLAPGQSASGYTFREQKFRNEFAVQNPAMSRLYVASASISPSDDNPFGASTPLTLPMAPGSNIWLSFDRGLTGRFALAASSSDGTIRLDVYNNNNFATPVASSGAAATSAFGEFDGNGQPQFLKVSGSGSAFQVTVTPIVVCAPASSSPIDADVILGSSQWSGAFLGALQSQSLGNGGFQVTGGSVNQFNPLPWTNIDQVSVRFAAPVTAGPGSLSVRGTNSGTIPIQSFSYNSATNTGTWTLSHPIATDRILLDLTAIPESFDLGGLDSGPEQFRLNVLSADVNRNGRATIADAVAVRNLVGTSAGNAGYSVFHDINGSGAIDVADRTLAMLNSFGTLPVSQVAPSPAAPAAIVATAPAATATANTVVGRETSRNNALGGVLRAPRRAADRATVDAALDSLLPARDTEAAQSSGRLRARRGQRPATVSAVVDSILSSL
jgi:subtilisin-like proprotein convertase family protein